MRVDDAWPEQIEHRWPSYGPPWWQRIQRARAGTQDDGMYAWAQLGIYSWWPRRGRG